ncbi:MAG: 3-keto-5-aminohexanoate cleavage protein [Holophaga sp.]|nr:3-keto-5-aminohexanoate cleavage protein [Holophaga sp.]
MLPTKDQTPHIPVTPEEIAQDVDACTALGASMVHLHARDLQGVPTYRKEIYADIIGRIRSRHPDLVLIASTSGRTYSEFSQRSEVLELEGDLRPDMGSLTLSSINFNKVASINSPDMICRLAERMQERGIKPELEVFDLGMVNYAHYLIRKGLITPPYYFNIILGNIAAAQAKLLHLGLIVAELPQDSVWSIGAVGDSQLRMNAVGVVCADGVRVGLEDNIYLDEERTTLATNAQLVGRVRRIAEGMGRPLASAAEVRSRLNLQR